MDAGITPPDDDGNETSEADYEEEDNDDADNEDNDDGDNAAGTDVEETGNDGDDGEKSDNEMGGGEENDAEGDKENEGKEAAGGSGMYEMIREEEEALDRNGGTSTLQYQINLISFLFFIYRSIDTKLKVQIQERQEFSHADTVDVRQASTRRSRQRRQWRAGHVCSRGERGRRQL